MVELKIWNQNNENQLGCNMNLFEIILVLE